MRMKRVVVMGLAVLLGTGALMAEGMLFGGAEGRAEKLKAGLKTFTLSLEYSGEQSKPYYQLLLSVPPLPLRRSENPFFQMVWINETQAAAIIDYLTGEGFLLKAQEGPFKRTPEPPYYALVVQVAGADQPLRYGLVLGWDLQMIRRLDGLRKVLEGDAARAMDLLLGRLAGHRAEWEKAAPPMEEKKDRPTM